MAAAQFDVARMRLILSTLVLSCFLALQCDVWAQDKQTTPAPRIADPTWLLPFDFYENIPHSDEEARMENFANELKKESELIGYIVVYAGQRSCAGEAARRALWAKSFLVKECGIQADRLLWKDGGYKEKATLEMWVRPKDVDAPVARPSLNLHDVQIVDCARKQHIRRRKRHPKSSSSR